MTKKDNIINKNTISHLFHKFLYLRDQHFVITSNTNGQCPYTLINFSKYVGEFKDNKMHGQGTFTFPDGEKYVGQYRNDKKHGEGTYTFANGTAKKGILKDGKFVGN